MRQPPDLSHPARSRALALLCCATVAAVAGGCDSRQLLAPATRAVGPPSQDGLRPPSIIGTASVSSEQTGGVPAGTVQKSTWVVVQVSGQYNATPNPACGSQPPNWPCILSPPASSFYAPAPFTSGPVQAWVASGGISAIPLRGTGGAANTAGQAVGLYFAPAAGQLMIRSAVENYITPNPNPGAQVSSWIISGSYNATATKISNPLTFSGGPTGAPDGTVTFTVGTTAPLLFINPNGVPASSPPGDVDWYIVPGDAVPLTYERTSPAYQIFACYRKTTCTYTPPPNLNGRMQVAAYVEGQLAIGRSEEIRSRPKLVGTLAVSCRPDSLLVGNRSICAASVSPATSILTVQTWHFAGDSLGVAFSATGDVKTWTFSPTVCGTVTVSGTVDGVAQSATTRVEVFCNMLNPMSNDSLLNDVLVQRAMRQYWAASYPNDTIVSNRREQGGLIVRDTATARLSVVPFSSNANPHLCTATLTGADFTPIFQNGGTVVGSFHTHPHDPGKAPPSNCNIRGAQNPGAVFGDGASPADYGGVNSPAFPMPMYIVDRAHVHRIRPGERFSRRGPHTETRSTTCT